MKLDMHSENTMSTHDLMLISSQVAEMTRRAVRDEIKLGIAEELRTELKPVNATLGKLQDDIQSLKMNVHGATNDISSIRSELGTGDQSVSRRIILVEREIESLEKAIKATKSTVDELSIEKKDENKERRINWFTVGMVVFSATFSALVTWITTRLVH